MTGIDLDNITEYVKKDGTTVYRIRRYNSRTGKSEMRTVTPPKGFENGRKLTVFLTDERNKFFREVDGGMSETNARITFSDYFMGPFKNSFTGRDKTWHDYEGLFRRHMQPYLGRLRMGDFNKQTIIGFFRYLDDEVKVGASTYNGIYRLLNSVLNNAVDDDILLKNPLNSKTIKKKEIVADTKSLSQGDLETLITCLNNEDLFWRTLFMLLISTGCRRGEIVGLRWENVHLSDDSPFIDIVHSVEYIPHEGTKLVAPKTSLSRRRVFIPEQVKEMLKGMYEECHKGFVFSIGDPETFVHPDSVNRHATLMCKKNNITHFTPHTLRRTMATTLATRASVDPKTLQLILGHSDLRTLLKYYVLPEDDVKKEAMEKYTQFFN